ncbi:MAG TPA: hypothetical protein PLS62_10805 [Desulfobacteraceae bacterium]|nr:hypothetical protein [Desulfobacteraceae bacterium]
MANELPRRKSACALHADRQRSILKIIERPKGRGYLSAVFMAGLSAVFMAGLSAFYQPLDGLPAYGWFTSLRLVGLLAD